MRLEDLPEVVVDRSGGYKFIVVQVDDDTGNARRIVRADKSKEYHMDIFEDVRRRFPREWNVCCIGGGRICVDPIERSVTIWDSSGSYGLEPDRAATLALLKSAFPEYEVSAR